METVLQTQESVLDIITRHLSIVPFKERVHGEGVLLTRTRIDTVQLNLGRLCNQSCMHCHVEGGPRRTEIMSREMAHLAVEFVRVTEAQSVDITGGAPELNPSFRWLVKQLVTDGRHVIDRCNLTVLLGPGQEDTPSFLAEQGVEIVASLPCYTKQNVDRQRGRGVFDKSIAALKALNALGYGKEGSGLALNLVYNPLGPFLPPCQQELEVDYRQELADGFGISFNRLLTMTNMPLGRFAQHLRQSKEYDAYWLSLVAAFNASTLWHLMCRSIVSVAWDGLIYDCDFNLILGLPLHDSRRPFRLGESSLKKIARQVLANDIQVGSHCYACTAGAGSSCQGALQ